MWWQLRDRPIPLFWELDFCFAILMVFFAICWSHLRSHSWSSVCKVNQSLSQLWRRGVGPKDKNSSCLETLLSSLSRGRATIPCHSTLVSFPVAADGVSSASFLDCESCGVRGTNVNLPSYVNHFAAHTILGCHPLTSLMIFCYALRASNSGRMP